MIKLSCVLAAGLLLAACSGGNGTSGSTGTNTSSGTTAGSGSTSSGGTGSTTGGDQVGNCHLIGIYDSTFQTSHGPGSGVTEFDPDAGWQETVILGQTVDGGSVDAGSTTTWIYGSWSLSNGQVTFMGQSGHSSNGVPIDYCPNEPGIYTAAYSADCNTLTLTKVSDTCQERVFEGNGTPLHRQ